MIARNMTLLKEQGGRCLVCQFMLMTDADISVHHVMPKRHGGPSERWNLVVLHRGCHDEVEKDWCAWYETFGKHKAKIAEDLAAQGEGW